MDIDQGQVNLIIGIIVSVSINVWLAKRKGRGVVKWILAGVFFNIISSIILFFLSEPQELKVERERAEREAREEAERAEREAREEAERAEREAYLRTPEGKREMAEIAEREAREEAERAKSKARDNLLYDLTDISGIDDKLARTLLDQFPDRQSIQDASAEELTDIPGLGSSKAKAIKARIG